MRYDTHSYRLAEELLNSRLSLRKEIEAVCREVEPKNEPHGKEGQFKYRERQLNDDFEKGFKARGWIPKVKVIEDLGLLSDFRKSRIQVEVQFGNASRWYADVMKFQLSFLKDEIDLGVEILPKKSFARAINDNLASYERAVKEIDRFKFAITLPIWVLGVEP